MKFDLTTEEGVKSVLLLGGPVGIIGYAAYKLGQKLLSADEAVAKQAEAAIEIIEAGRRNGVKKMRLVVDHKVGAHFEVPIEGVNIEIVAGSKGKIELDIEYA